MGCCLKNEEIPVIVSYISNIDIIFGKHREDKCNKDE